MTVWAVALSLACTAAPIKPELPSKRMFILIPKFLLKEKYVFLKTGNRFEADCLVCLRYGLPHGFQFSRLQAAYAHIQSKSAFHTAVATAKGKPSS